MQATKYLEVLAPRACINFFNKGDALSTCKKPKTRMST